MTTYRLVLHEDAAHLFAGAPRAEQRRLAAVFDALKLAPFRSGDLFERDEAGRDNQIIVAGDWIVTFWADHAVQELRIVRLENANDGH